MSKYVRLALVLVAPLALGCAQLHHVQVGDIDNSPGYTRKPIDIKMSETGINIQEVGQAARLLLDKRGGKEVGQAAAIVGLFQMGPHTGNAVYTQDYAKGLVEAIYKECPSGRVTGLTSIRETRKYPIVSGEIVKITGTCLMPKKG